MPLERRGTTRRSYRWTAEATDVESGSRLQGVTRDVGLFGCFVETMTPFLSGRVIALKITHDNQTFAVAGEVAYAVAGEGMGIAFGAIAPGEYTVLKGWLLEDPPGDAPIATATIQGRFRRLIWR
jgi:PilZ domain